MFIYEGEFQKPQTLTTAAAILTLIYFNPTNMKNFILFYLNQTKRGKIWKKSIKLLH